MTSKMHSNKRAALLALVALPGAAVGITREARASESWHFTIVDGPGSSGHGNIGNTTTEGVNGASAAVYVPPFGVMPIYARNTTSGWGLWTGLDVDFKGSSCNGTDGYSIQVVDDTDLGLFGPGALQDGDNTWIGYTDQDGDLFADVNGGPGPGLPIFSGDGGFGTELVVGAPSLALLGAGTYNGFIFYTASYASSGDEVHYQYYNNGMGAVWSGDSSSTIIDGPGVGGNPSSYPTAIDFNGSLWAFYYDSIDECLKGKTSGSSNGHLGSDWTATYASGASYECIDGYGGSSGQNLDIVGQHATAYVDTNASPNRLYVFYYDASNHSLRASYLNAGSSSTSWTAEVVDASVTIDDPSGQYGLPVIAPVWNGADQVYYVDSANHRVKATQRSSGSWISPSVIDGTGCTPSGCTHDDLDGPISIVVSPECLTDSGSGPHLFYADSHTNALREAFWE